MNRKKEIIALKERVELLKQRFDTEKQVTFDRLKSMEDSFLEILKGYNGLFKDLIETTTELADRVSASIKK